MYRIITDGKIFKVQHKGWLFWNTVGRDVADMSGAGGWQEYEFHTQKEAKKYIDELNQTWRVCATYSLV